MQVYFGKDHVDNYPIGPVKLDQNDTFFFDPHQGDFQRLFILSQSTRFAAGSGSDAAFPGVQNAWYRASSSLPGSPNELK
jgi:hypothetical protein